MSKTAIISPSILSADFMNLEAEIAHIEQAGAGLIHVDVMDGHFVPNLTIGVPHVAQLKKIAHVPLDVHLMIDNPLHELPWFLDAGADIISAHAETLNHETMPQVIDLVHTAGKKVSIALKPPTDVSVLEGVIANLDMVLIMSVEPGFSGQSYKQGTEDKVAAVCALAQNAGTEIVVEVDGGINAETAKLVCGAGASVLVAGNAIFASADKTAALQEIKQAAQTILDEQGTQAQLFK